MNLDKEKIIFILKVLLCTSLIGVWIVSLNSIPEIKKEKISKTENNLQDSSSLETASNVVLVGSKPERTKSNKQEEKKESIGKVVKEQKKEPVTKTAKVAEVKKEIKEQKKEPIAKIEKLADVSKEIHQANKQEVKKMLNESAMDQVVIQENKQKIEETPVSPPVVGQQVDPSSQPIMFNFANLNFPNLPNVAGATRKALETTKKIDEMKLEKEKNLNVTENTSLRKEAEIEKNNLKPITAHINELKNEAKIKEEILQQKPAKEEVKAVESSLNNVEKIADQIEVQGFVNSSNGEQAVILRNTTNNKVDVLNKGDNYQGLLKIVDIKNNEEVILGNDALNKTFVKKVNVQN